MSELKPTAPATAPAAGYHDFASLGALRGKAGGGKAEAAREAAVQFEAHFVQQMLKTMRESVMKSELVESGAADTYQDMMDKEVSLSIARGRGLGLATMLERELHKPGVSALDALKARDAAGHAGMPLQRPAVALPVQRTGEGPGMALPQPVPLKFTPAVPSASRTGAEP
jgi:flagellar protein FlgJ